MRQSPAKTALRNPFLQRAAASLFLIVYGLLAWHRLQWLQLMTGSRAWWDFQVYYTAYLKAANGRNPYEPFHIGQGFLNHPFVLTFVGLFSGHGNAQLAAALWFVASLVAWAAALYLTIRYILRRRLRLFPFILLLSSAPVVETFYMGQINAFAVLCLSLCFLYAQKGKAALAGFTLALAAVFKSSPLLLLFYFLAVRKGRVVVMALLFLLGLGGITAVQFSPHLFSQFGRVLLRLVTEVEAGRYNYSLLSLAQHAPVVAGWEQADRYLLWGHKIIVGGTLATLLAVSHSRATFQKSDRCRLFALFLCLMVIFSPLLWYHHFVFLLLPLAMLLYHPSAVYATMGLAIIFLFQADRLFTGFFNATLLAQLLLLGAIWHLWREARRRAAVPN